MLGRFQRMSLATLRARLDEAARGRALGHTTSAERLAAAKLDAARHDAALVHARSAAAEARRREDARRGTTAGGLALDAALGDELEREASAASVRLNDASAAAEARAIERRRATIEAQQTRERRERREAEDAARLRAERAQRADDEADEQTSGRAARPTR